jgi:hypothetical protein
MNTIKMNTIKMMLTAGFLLLAATSAKPAAAGETLTGTWEGHMYVQRGKIPANAAFNWKTGKWNFNVPTGVAWASWAVALEIQGPFKNLSGTYLAKDKNNAKSWGKYEWDGNFNFEKKLLVWTPDKQLEGPNKLNNTVVRSLTYSQDGDFEYLKGRWAAQSGDTGIMEFRRDYDGKELKDEGVVSDFMLPETGVDYVIKKGDFFLALNDDKDGILSKKDASEEARKWKFEAAPDQFPKAFRIVPSSKEDKCLVPTDDDTGKVVLADKADTPEGEQYWRFEKNGDGVMLTNVKLGGRAIYINDEDTGDTIIRSRNEAHENKWTLEKQ